MPLPRTNARYKPADEECEDKGDNVRLPAAPHADVDGVEEAEEREAPADAVDDDVLAVRGELVDHSAEEEQVNEGPDAERPRRRRHVGLLAVPVREGRARDGVDVRPEEEEVRQDVHDLCGDAVSMTYDAWATRRALSRMPSFQSLAMFVKGRGARVGG
jgi:hypothetical protein